MVPKSPVGDGILFPLLIYHKHPTSFNRLGCSISYILEPRIHVYETFMPWRYFLQGHVLYMIKSTNKPCQGEHLFTLCSSSSRNTGALCLPLASAAFITLLVIPPNPRGARVDGPSASSLSDPDASASLRSAGSRSCVKVDCPEAADWHARLCWRVLCFPGLPSCCATCRQHVLLPAET